MKGSSIKLYEHYDQLEKTGKEFNNDVKGLKQAFERRKTEKNLNAMRKIILINWRENEKIFNEGIEQLKKLKNHPNYYINGRARGILNEINSTEEKKISEIEKLEDKIMSYRSEHPLKWVGELEEKLKENEGNKRIKIAVAESLRKIAMKHPNNDVHNASIKAIKKFLEKNKR